MVEPRIPKPTSGHLDGSFFFGVQRSDYNFNFEVSRGPFSISTLRCPEVTTTSAVSRGPFRDILNGRLDASGALGAPHLRAVLLRPLRVAVGQQLLSRRPQLVGPFVSLLPSSVFGPFISFLSS